MENTQEAKLDRMAALAVAGLVVAAKTEKGTMASYVADETVLVAQRLMTFLDTGD